MRLRTGAVQHPAVQGGQKCRLFGDGRNGPFWHIANDMLNVSMVGYSWNLSAAPHLGNSRFRRDLALRHGIRKGQQSIAAAGIPLTRGGPSVMGQPEKSRNRRNTAGQPLTAETPTHMGRPPLQRCC